MLADGRIEGSELGWVVLTTGERASALRRAVESITAQATTSEIVVVANCDDSGLVEAQLDGIASVRVIGGDGNIGVPGGRDRGLRALPGHVHIVGFLDDDAELTGADTSRRVIEEFSDHRLGAVSLRLVDETGRTAARHVPRPGDAAPEQSGDVVNFLGGASAIRRVAYDDAGGYWPALWYGHEELDLAWRLADRSWAVRYLGDVLVFHPRTEISRHGDGWRLTGRNRVMVARRNLPLPVMVVHVLIWLVLGAVRAPRTCRRQYVRGWRSGWSEPVGRVPIGWSTVWRLTRLGRPPVI